MENLYNTHMRDFYNFHSCNYLTTFYASNVRCMEFVKQGEFKKCHRFEDALKWGDYSSEDISFPVVFKERRESGKRMRDILDNRNVAFYLISDRFRDALEKEGITGWKCYPVEIYDKKGNLVHGYNGFSVTGRAGKMQEYDVPPVELGYDLESYGFYFEYDSWDGSDIFNTENSNFLIVTERFIEVIRKYKITACQFARLTEYGSLRKLSTIR